LILYYLPSRKHARALRLVANGYVDEVLSAARSYIEEKGMSQVSIPNIEAYFSKEVSFTLNVLNICNYGGKNY
jgi:hypothetical protein